MSVVNWFQAHSINCDTAVGKQTLVDLRKSNFILFLDYLAILYELHT